MSSFGIAKASLIFFNKSIRVFGYKVVKYLKSCLLNELVKLTMLSKTWPRCFMTELAKIVLASSFKVGDIICVYL